MLVLTVKFQSNLSYDEVMAVVQERISDFRALSGLIQKYYGYEKSTGAYTGVYIWESAEAMRAYRESELAQTIAAAYQAVEPPRIEIFNLIETLRPIESAATVS
ncbi:MAG: YdhR family protein [Thermomicrobiales bacterium]